MRQMAKILITDGDCRSALAATRSLAKNGHTVIVTAANAKSIASCSRYCSKRFVVPDPMIYGNAYTSEICELVERENINIILPMTEQSIYLLNPARKQLATNVKLGCPEESMMNTVSDKYQLFKNAEKMKVPIPRTFFIDGIEDLNETLDKIDNYPIVVKPALSKRTTANGFLSGSVRYAENRSELEIIYQNYPVLQYPSLIQEKIIGPGTGLFTLYDKNRHLSLFSHRRLREKPPWGGVSVVSESVPLDDEMVAAADRLLSEVGFTGVAMVEFKRDRRDGKAKLMEINGRFWGTLQLAISCGVDFPLLYLDYLEEKRPLFRNRSYMIGHKLKWLFGTLDHLIINLKKDSSDDIISKFRSIFDFLNYFESNTSYDVFNLDDLYPFICEALIYFREAVKR